jgi:UrcA family protein
MNAKQETAALSRPKLTLLMVLCGLGAVSASAAGAATQEGDVPAIAVKYDPQSLVNDGAVRALYGRIVAASRNVCPDMSVGRIPSASAEACRRQSIARAVMHVNNPRLAALYATSSKNG